MSQPQWQEFWDWLAKSIREETPQQTKGSPTADKRDRRDLYVEWLYGELAKLGEHPREQIAALLDTLEAVDDQLTDLLLGAQSTLAQLHPLISPEEASGSPLDEDTQPFRVTQRDEPVAWQEETERPVPKD